MRKPLNIFVNFLQKIEDKWHIFANGECSIYMASNIKMFLQVYKESIQISNYWHEYDTIKRSYSKMSPW